LGRYWASHCAGTKNALGGWTRHAFLEVGGTRVSQVLVRPVHEQLLRSAIGEEVELSLSRFGRTHRLEALRTAKDGVSKPPLHWMFMGVIYKLVHLLIALIGVVFFGAIAWGLIVFVVGHSVDNKTLLSVAVAAAIGLFALWLIWGNLSGIVKTWAAWAAL
jgi:hypothetical protein